MIISYCHQRPPRPVASFEFPQMGLHETVGKSLNPGPDGLRFDLKLCH